MRIRDLDVSEVAGRLSGDGLGLLFGPFAYRIHSPIAVICESVRVLYADHVVLPAEQLPDFRVEILPTLRRARRTVTARVNGEYWQGWPRRLSVAAMEWVVNWCLSRCVASHLSIHAAVAALPEHPDCAVILPGNSGAGKSTLAATLMLSGWDLLSDEFAMLDLESGGVSALGRPVILKGASLDLIEARFQENVCLGPAGMVVADRTRIAHLKPNRQSVAACGREYRPRLIVFPSRDSGEQSELRPVSPGQAMSRIAQQAINFRVVGEPAFGRLLELVRGFPAFEIGYAEAVEAERLLRQLVLDRAAEQDGPSKAAHRVVHAGGEEASGPGVPDDVSAGASAPTAWAGGRLCSVPPVGLHGVDASRGIPIDEVAPENGEDAGTPEPNRSCRLHRIADDSIRDLIRGILEPESLTRLSDHRWDRVLPLAVRAGLDSRLARSVVRCDGRDDQIPGAIARRLRDRWTRTQFAQLALRHELRQLSPAFEAADAPAVLLKGAAYLAADFRWADGRTTRDVDILVPEDTIDSVEERLRSRGYRWSGKVTRGDALYYRRWLHECAPTFHPYRRIELDLHFRLLPKSDPISFDPAAFIGRSVAISDGRWRILDPVDRVLHSLLHLTRVGDFCRGLHDLLDVVCLTEDWNATIDRPQTGEPMADGSQSLSANPDTHSLSPAKPGESGLTAPLRGRSVCFRRVTQTPPEDRWSTLVQRARDLGAEKSIVVGLCLAEELVGLAVPEGVIQALAGCTPQRVRGGWVYRMMRLASLPNAEGASQKLQASVTRFLGYYPVPRARVWLDPLTWTKRVPFLQD